MSTIKKVTLNYNFRIPVFDAPGWGREIERNLDVIDAALFLASGIRGIKGVWTTGTSYTVGDTLIDVDNATIWRCLISHISAASGVFEDDRTNNPTYWSLVPAAFTSGGTWAPATAYGLNQFIQYDNIWSVSTKNYVSSNSFDQDVLDGNLLVLLDVTLRIAEQADAEAGESPTLLMSPLGVKQYVSNQIGETLASKDQGTKADTAVQPDDLAVVATTGAYADLDGKPTLGSAAALAAEALATAAQGAKADTALQQANGVFRIATFAGAPSETIPDIVERVFVEDRRAHFVRVESEPTHALKFQNGDQWWEVDEPRLSIAAFGAVGDDWFGGTMNPAAHDDGPAFLQARDWMLAAPTGRRREVYLESRVYRTTVSIDCSDAAKPISWIGPGRELCAVRADFKAAGGALFDMRFTTEAARVAGHKIHGIAALGRNRVGDPIAFRFDKAFYADVNDIGVPVFNSYAYRNFCIFATIDFNSHWSNILSYRAGCSLNPFWTVPTTTVSYTSGQKTVTAAAGVFTAGMAGELIMFLGGGTESATSWVATIDTVDSPTQVTLVENAPRTASGVRASVGVTTGSMTNGSDVLTVNYTSIFTADHVGMYIAVPGAELKTVVPGSPAGLLMGWIVEVIDSQTVRLDVAATATVSDVVVYGPGAGYLGRMSGEAAESGTGNVNHSWWRNIHHEAYSNAGQTFARITWANFDNLKCHGIDSSVQSPPHSGCLTPIMGTQINDLTINGLQLAYSLGAYDKGHIWITASRGVLRTDAVQPDHSHPTPLNRPMVRLDNVTSEFRLYPGQWAVVNRGAVGLAADWRPFPAPSEANVVGGSVKWISDNHLYHGTDPELLIKYMHTDGALSHTGDTSETAVLEVPFSASELAGAAMLEVDVLARAGAVNSNNKTLRFRLGLTSGGAVASVGFRTLNLASVDHARENFAIAFRSDGANQIGRPTTTSIYGYGASSGAPQMTTLNTSSALTLYATVELVNSADILTIEMLIVKLWRKRRVAT